MGENYPLGPALTFVPDEDVGVAFTPTPISKADARSIGMAFCEASDDEREAMLADLDPKMVRRSLLAFANLAARMDERTPLLMPATCVRRSPSRRRVRREGRGLHPVVEGQERRPLARLAAVVDPAVGEGERAHAALGRR
jgi:hypothetical protein